MTSHQRRYNVILTPNARWVFIKAGASITTRVITVDSSYEYVLDV